MDIQFDLGAIRSVAMLFWEKFASDRVFAFHGVMGAGKTTFIRALCEARGVQDAIGSPTFSIINEYHYPQSGKIFHIDLYRLKDEEEAVRAGVEDILYGKSLCLVEWPERAPEIFPPGTVHLHLDVLDPLTRKITSFESI
ncbi:MAG: tRNA (adenosine(37)-N6)-threonylcarbamoyltransferase complex ATPase subunit type 1 TsaE [Bacteroidota bacterium]|nr:tRNA (adenosine(37)-N6)-threonylcarbamoyltransferase complex ATPase subunit type 1 TsaE [Bacteroidota bacterium]MDP4215403.1 tRNA (adenosine(37)-N6)-threonylcarbamoyltransferase complex ATPase subunit type 1 TsaE [Bacteroidota bacterium]MDP4254223.1 tRNA (adenosine(37)-N6)-threonylcarbamoyltransferase complex ATPase subunit type 1 TsaE [Bacteroidota bacterium]MDP4256754.1 tRNA (adenosine(37)-N6)-threonylcarbamoyltransferase complex ATPase subunit type 1 TsaE [Bacteroidota bacterium]